MNAFIAVGICIFESIIYSYVVGRIVLIIVAIDIGKSRVNDNAAILINLALGRDNGIFKITKI